MRLPCPWDSLGKNTKVGSHFLLWGIFPTQGSNPSLCVSCIAGRLFTTEPPGNHNSFNCSIADVWINFNFSKITFCVLFCLFVYDGANNSNTGQWYGTHLCFFSLCFVTFPYCGISFLLFFPYTYVAKATVCYIKCIFSSSFCAPGGSHFTTSPVVIVVMWFYLAKEIWGVMHTKYRSLV